MKGSAHCCLERSGEALRSDQKVRWSCPKSPRWSAGRRACR